MEQENKPQIDLNDLRELSSDAATVIQYIRGKSEGDIDYSVKLGEWVETILARAKAENKSDWKILLTLYEADKFLILDGPREGQWKMAYAARCSLAPAGLMSNEEAAKLLEDDFRMFECNDAGLIVNMHEAIKPH